MKLSKRSLVLAVSGAASLTPLGAVSLVGQAFHIPPARALPQLQDPRLLEITLRSPAEEGTGADGSRDARLIVVDGQLLIDNGSSTAVVPLRDRTIREVVDDLRSREIVAGARSLQPDVPAIWLNRQAAPVGHQQPGYLDGTARATELVTGFGAVLAPGAGSGNQRGVLDGAGVHFNVIGTGRFDPTAGRVRGLSDGNIRVRMGLALDEAVVVSEESRGTDSAPPGMRDLLDQATQVVASASYEIPLGPARAPIQPLLSLELGGTWNRFDTSGISVPEVVQVGGETRDASQEAMLIRNHFGRVEPAKYYSVSLIAAAYEAGSLSFYGGLGFMRNEVIVRSIRPLGGIRAPNERCFEYRCAQVNGDTGSNWRALFGANLRDIVDLRLDAVGGFDRSIDPLLRILLIKPFEITG
jgi:hypothetical protein